MYIGEDYTLWVEVYNYKKGHILGVRKIQPCSKLRGSKYASPSTKPLVTQLDAMWVKIVEMQITMNEKNKTWTTKDARHIEP